MNGEKSYTSPMPGRWVVNSCCDVTVICPLANSYVKRAAREVGMVAASRNEAYLQDWVAGLSLN